MDGYSSDVLSFANKDGKILMEQDNNGKINVTDKTFAAKIKEKNDGKLPADVKENLKDTDKK